MHALLSEVYAAFPFSAIAFARYAMALLLLAITEMRWIFLRCVHLRALLFIQRMLQTLSLSLVCTFPFLSLSVCVFSQKRAEAL